MYNTFVDICKNINITGKNGRQAAILNLRKMRISSYDLSYLKPPTWIWNGCSMCNTFGDICKTHQNCGKKWPPGGHLEYENDENILIWFVIPQNPPFGTGTDALCAILLEIYVKNIKIAGKNGRRAANLNLRMMRISSCDSSYLKTPHLELERMLYVQYFWRYM